MMKRFLGGCGVLSLLLTASAASAAVSTCSINQKYKCSKGGGCVAVANSIVVRIDWSRRVYSRCDSKGCDDFEAQMSKSGAFINIALAGKGVLAKLSADGSDFMEVVTLMTDALVSHGSCQTTQ